MRHPQPCPPPRPLQAPGSPGYRYNAVVRNKAERAMLPAVECAQCKAFFRALASWGGPQEREDAASAGVHCKHGEGGGPPRLHRLPACLP